MMKKVLGKCFILLFAVSVILPLSSCDDIDDWFDDDLWEYVSEEHDRRIEDNMIGHWVVSYVDGSIDGCPYAPYDHFYFRPSGKFEVIGDRGFEEFGRWYVKNGRICISFSRDYRRDIVCRIQRMNRRFVSLKMDDYDMDMRYYIDLEKIR